MLRALGPAASRPPPPCEAALVFAGLQGHPGLGPGGGTRSLVVPFVKGGFVSTPEVREGEGKSYVPAEFAIATLQKEYGLIGLRFVWINSSPFCAKIAS